jgi:hypothetical protein
MPYREHDDVETWYGVVVRGRKYVASTRADSVFTVAIIPRFQEPTRSFCPSAEKHISSALLVKRFTSLIGAWNWRKSKNEIPLTEGNETANVCDPSSLSNADTTDLLSLHCHIGFSSRRSQIQVFPSIAEEIKISLFG